MTEWIWKWSLNKKVKAYSVFSGSIFPLGSNSILIYQRAETVFCFVLFRFWHSRRHDGYLSLNKNTEGHIVSPLSMGPHSSSAIVLTLTDCKLWDNLLWIPLRTLLYIFLAACLSFLLLSGFLSSFPLSNTHTYYGFSLPLSSLKKPFPPAYNILQLSLIFLKHLLNSFGLVSLKQGGKPSILIYQLMTQSWLMWE